MKSYDIIIVGGGCAGMAAALSAKADGVENILIIERSPYLGGVLQQCIHNGFGIHRFNRDLTGVEYAELFINQIEDNNIEYLTDTIVLSIDASKNVTAMNGKHGLIKLCAKAIILSTGCRERSRGALLIPGSRPAGIFSAGTAQRLMNLDGYLVGRKIVILGSGDIGLIMARQFVLEGAQVLAVAELMPYSGGLARNIVQCLEDFNIPLFYNTTVSRIVGKDRLCGVYLSEVDENRKPKKDTERFIECDTLILSVGLIPENELAYSAGIDLSPVTGGAVVNENLQTGIPGIFACGNALHVHDLVDFVSIESEAAGKSAAKFVKSIGSPTSAHYTVSQGFGVSGIVPQLITHTGSENIKLQFRPSSKFYNGHIEVVCNSAIIARKKFLALTPGEMCELLLDRSKINGNMEVRVNQC